MTRAILLLALVGCGRLGFDAADGSTDASDSVDDTTDAPGDDDGDADADADDSDNTHDGMAGPDAAGTCALTGGTTFPGGLPCSNWGANRNFTNAGMSESNGSLTVTPNANSAGAGGSCQRQGVALGAVEVEISGVLTGTNAQTGFRIVTGGTDFVFSVENGILTGEVGPISFTAAYAATTMRWLRIRPAGAFTAYEISADGTSWNDFGFASMTLPATGSVEVFATTPTAVAAPGTARFETVHHCD